MFTMWDVETLEALLNQLAAHEFSEFLARMKNKKYTRQITETLYSESFSRAGEGNIYVNAQNGQQYEQVGILFRTPIQSEQTLEQSYGETFWGSLKVSFRLKNNNDVVNYFLDALFSRKQPTKENFQDFLKTLDYFINDCIPRDSLLRTPLVDPMAIYYDVWRRITDVNLGKNVLEHASLNFARSRKTWALERLRLHASNAGISLKDPEKQKAFSSQSLMIHQAQKILSLIEWLEKRGYAQINHQNGNVTFSAGNHVAINDIGQVLNQGKALAVFGASVTLQGVNYLRLKNAFAQNETKPHDLDNAIIEIQNIHNDINQTMEYHENKGFFISLHRKFKAWETERSCPNKGTSVEMLNLWKSSQPQSAELRSNLGLN